MKHGGTPERKGKRYKNGIRGGQKKPKRGYSYKERVIWGEGVVMK